MSDFDSEFLAARLRSRASVQQRSYAFIGGERVEFPTEGVAPDYDLIAAANKLEQLTREVAECKRDAERYRWLKGNHALLWSPEFHGCVKWVRYIKMDDPDVRAEVLTETSVMEALDRAIDAAIRQGASEEATTAASGSTPHGNSGSTPAPVSSFPDRYHSDPN